MNITALVQYTNKLLRISEFKDYCPNGLQVAGQSEVKQIVAGVTASQALIEKAIEAKADLLLVHHGFFWKGEDPCVVGMKQKRLKLLLENDINLLAYHLPLDAHPEFGNNAQLANLLNFKITGELDTGPGPKFGFVGELSKPMTAEALTSHIEKMLAHPVLHLPAQKSEINTIAWCSGGAQNYAEQAAKQGADAYLTGEASEYNFHVASELNCHYFAAGHHATERFGVQALGGHLSEQFGLAYQFIDLENPV